MKKALRDALKSVVTDERKSEIASSEVDSSFSSLNRITHAAKLLKEFQQIHKLSETVKRTLTEYNSAKSDLSQSIKDNSGVNMLKRFLVGRTKRTYVPHVNLTLGDVKPMEIKSMILDNPHYLKHTDRISILAKPLTTEKGKIGLEFISVDPKTSTLDRAKKAFKAANILLDYVGSKRKDSTEHVDGLIETLRNDIDGTYKETNVNEKKKKSLLASKANNLFIDKPDSTKQVTGEKKQMIETNENKFTDTKSNNNNNKMEGGISKAKKTELATEIEQEKEDELKKINGSSKKTQQDISASATKKSKNEISTNADEMLHSTLKQQETLQTLKEAKLARQKYEIARHELAEKVKELYKMANDYEKEETDNQVLEVKNDHIPKSHNLSLPLEDNVHVPHFKRDDAHPGMALSGVSNHPVRGISTATSGDNGEHKAFTMGAIDKKEHQVDVDNIQSTKTTSESKMLLNAVPAKRKSVEDTTNSLPSNIKLDELKDEVGKNMKSQEESLKVIAEAIKEDMKDIANVNKKKKMVAEAMTTNDANKKDKQSTDKLDEYLTKALSDIMGPESVPGNEAGKEAEVKQKEKAENYKNTKEDNMKIIAEAMKSSTNDLPLPLISTKGDKIVPLKNGDGGKTGKTDQRGTNDVLQHVSDNENSNKKPLDLNDPANKSLLEKASHLEEQIASQQDKLYSSNGADNGPSPAKPNVEFSPSEPKSSAEPVKPAATPSATAMSSGTSGASNEGGKKDAYGSIKETISNPAERGKMTDEEPYEDDGM